LIAQVNLRWRRTQRTPGSTQDWLRVRYQAKSCGRVTRERMRDIAID
jgi:hypothetical protein